jgi:hypothetical protein
MGQTTHLTGIIQDEEDGRYESDRHQQAEGVSEARQFLAT